jgi:hypothetical protein
LAGVRETGEVRSGVAWPGRGGVSVQVTAK